MRNGETIKSLNESLEGLGMVLNEEKQEVKEEYEEIVGENGGIKVYTATFPDGKLGIGLKIGNEKTILNKWYARFLVEAVEKFMKRVKE